MKFLSQFNQDFLETANAKQFSILNNNNIFFSFIDETYKLNLLIYNLNFEKLASRKIQLAEVNDIQLLKTNETIYIAYADDSDNDILLSLDLFLNTLKKSNLEIGMATECEFIGANGSSIIMSTSECLITIEAGRTTKSMYIQEILKFLQRQFFISPASRLKK